MANLAPFFRTQFFTAAGAPLALGKLFAFVSGTATPKATFTDATEAAQNPHPIILDASGSCDLWLSATGAYTLRLETSTSVLVDTWDGVAATPGAPSTAFLPLAGGTMTGAITLPGNGTAALHAVPKQQVESLIATTNKPASSITVADAGNFYVGTQAESVLQEIGPRITPALTGQAGKFLTNNGTITQWSSANQTHFELTTEQGQTATRNIVLTPGTWRIRLQVGAMIAETGNYSFQTTQTAGVGATILNAAIDFIKSGASGHGRVIHGMDTRVSDRVVATEETVAMTINSISLNGATRGTGSILTAHKVA